MAELNDQPVAPPAVTGPPVRARRLLVAAGGIVLASLVAGTWLLWPAWRMLGGLDGAVHGAPSRLYARALVLHVGDTVRLPRVREELAASGYHEDVADASPAPGRFHAAPGGVIVDLRRFPTPTGIDPGGPLEIEVAQGRVTRLERGGRPVESASLEPVLLASYVGEERIDRRCLPPGPLPEPLVHAVLAAEDDGFFSHPGISLPGIARAAWVDLRKGEAAQGGSTLTQQLVKNTFLDGERTLGRKAREALLAMLVELRYSKRQILRAYLDGVYLGASDGASLVGVGAAARAYFGKDADQLSLAEAATLAGMLAAPAHTSPIGSPDRARARRDWVLQRMATLGWATPEAARRAAAAPVEAFPVPASPVGGRYFAAVAQAEAGARAGASRLDEAGLTLLSTLDWHDQRAAEIAVSRGLGRLEGRRRAGTLQAALVSLDPRDGGVLAYVGGRDWTKSQFDRAGDARRQAGSAFKPIVYATAFARGIAAPATVLVDEPLSIRTAGNVWEPRDDDDEFLGPLPARSALEQSRNLPAVRLALDTGLDNVAATARAMGITSPLDVVPSLALGANAISPRELATVYATLAAGGVRPAVHTLAAVVGPDGRPVPLAALPVPERALSPAVAYLLTDVLRGVLERGTASSARELGIEDAVAGKTGTSNEGRDGWFAGFSPDRATVVWVGRDDDAPAHLTGAGSALPIWAGFTRAVRPAGGFPAFEEPAGVVHVLVDPASGELATTSCPEVRSELFLADHAPTATCSLHRGWLALPVAQPEVVPAERPGAIRRFFARLFGRHPRPS